MHLLKMHRFTINHPAEPAYFREFQAMENVEPAVSDYKETLLNLLQHPTIASKEWVYDQFDTKYVQVQLLHQVQMLLSFVFVERIKDLQ